MIKSVSDFSFVDVDPFKGFLDEFESYPARANAADGMPYGSLSDLEGKLDPPLKCLDPAWLTELVREVDWFRRHGFTTDEGVGMDPPMARPVEGAKQPPVVLKDFLEESRRTVRGWTKEWEFAELRDFRTPPVGVVVEEGLPTSWTPIGAITMPWSADGDYDLPPGADDYELPEDWVDPKVVYTRVLSEKAVRDFLSIRLFDGEMPDDDPTVPRYAWQEADDKLENGVSVKYLSRQLLALHSDCEKATLMLVDLNSTVLHVDPPDRYNHALSTQDGSTGPSEYDYSGYVSAGSPNSGPYANYRIPVLESRTPEYAMRYSYKEEEDYDSYTYSDGGSDHYWSRKKDETELDAPNSILRWTCSVPDFAEIEKVWVVMFARSRKLDSRVSVDEHCVHSSTTVCESKSRTTGTYDAQLFFALVPAEYSDGTITVRSIPDVPQPSGGVKVDPPNGTSSSASAHEATDGDSASAREATGGDSTSESSTRRHTTVDAAEIVLANSAVVKVKFRAGVKGV